jgi:hypothetical protein
MGAFECWEGIQERLLTISGIGDVLLGEPRGAIDKPAIYGIYSDFDTVLKSSPPGHGLRGKEHRFQLDLIISWVDQVAAETQLLGLLDAVTDSIEDDPHLGGRVPNGAAWCSRGVTGFATLGGSKFRIARYTCNVVEKRAT